MFRFLGIELDPAVEAFCRGQQEKRTPFKDPTRDLEKGVTASDWPSIFSPEEQARSLELIGSHPRPIWLRDRGVACRASRADREALAATRQLGDA